MEEIWIDIIETDNNYSVSNLTRIRNNKTGRILKQRMTDKGYIVITFNYDDKILVCKVHRIIMKYHKPIENPENYDVNHINWDKTDNRLCNLEWISREKNLALRRMEFESFKTLAKLHKKYTESYLNEYLLKIK